MGDTGGSSGASSNIFGAKPPTGGGLFGGGSGAGSGSGNGLAPAGRGGGLFGGATSSTTTVPTNSFGVAPTSTASFAPTGAPSNSIFGSSNTTTPAAASTSIFGGGAANATATSATHTQTAPTSNNSLFGGPSTGSFLSKPGEQSTSSLPKPAMTSFFSQPSSSAGTTSTTSGGFFSLPPKPGDTTKSAGAVPPASSTLSGGGLFGKTAAAPSSPATSTPAPATGGIFGNLGGESKKDTAAPAPAFSLFGAKSEEKKDAPANSTPTSIGLSVPKDMPPNPAEASGSNAFSGLGALAGKSTNATPAVAVAPPSMLRGKTIEEIVNGWSADLENHIRDFNKFAAEVAVWDRALIENGNNLSALYSHVLTAEREQNDIDQSLDHIEQQQKELAATLDAYERVTQDILGSQGSSLRALDTGPADTERDKNYMLATDLHTQLDDLSASLSQMIDSVNALALPSNESGPADDPMAQIAQILSSHLESLQWIDGAVREVEMKLTDVEKRVKDSGHSTGSKSRGFGPSR